MPLTKLSVCWKIKYSPCRSLGDLFDWYAWFTRTFPLPRQRTPRPDQAAVISDRHHPDRNPTVSVPFGLSSDQYVSSVVSGSVWSTFLHQFHYDECEYEFRLSVWSGPQYFSVWCPFRYDRPNFRGPCTRRPRITIILTILPRPRTMPIILPSRLI